LEAMSFLGGNRRRGGGGEQVKEAKKTAPVPRHTEIDEARHKKKTKKEQGY